MDVARWNNPRSKIWKQWSDWSPLDEALVKIPTKSGGAYVLGLAGEGHVVRRLLGDDRHGILDIGESKSLRSRVGKLRACVSNDSVRGHMAGWRYRYLRLHEALPGGLQIAFRLGEDSYALEGELLRHYVKAFGELPPLNYKFNWSS